MIMAYADFIKLCFNNPVAKHIDPDRHYGANAG